MIPAEVAYVGGRSLTTIVEPSAWRTLLETDIGLAWAVRAIVIAFGGLGLVFTVRHHRSGWWRSSLVAMLIAIGAAFAYGGHGATGRWMLVGVSATIIHVVAMMVWIGGLVGLLLGLDTMTSATARRWSRIAFVSASTVAVSGSVQAVRQLHRFAALYDSEYGRLLTAKSCAVGLVLCFALVGRRLIRGDAEPGSLRRSVGTEVLFAAAVIALTGSLIGANPNTSAAAGLYAETLVSDDYIASADDRPGGDRGEPAPPLSVEPRGQPVAARFGDGDDRRADPADRPDRRHDGRRRGESLPVDRPDVSIPGELDADDPDGLRHVHRDRVHCGGARSMSLPSTRRRGSAATPGCTTPASTGRPTRGRRAPQPASDRATLPCAGGNTSWPGTADRSIGSWR